MFCRTVNTTGCVQIVLLMCGFSVYAPPDLVEGLDGVLDVLLEDNIQVWAMGGPGGHPRVHTLLDKLDAASDQPVAAALRAAASLKSPTLYIFTSGTTGECEERPPVSRLSLHHDEVESSSGAQSPPQTRFLLLVTKTTTTTQWWLFTLLIN